MTKLHIQVRLAKRNGNESRMTPNIFEVIAIHSRDMEPVRFGIGHVNEIRTRTSSNFQSISEAAGAQNSDEGVSLAGIRWDISENSCLSLVELYGWETFNTLYLESERTIDFGLKSVRRAGHGVDQRSGLEWFT